MTNIFEVEANASQDANYREHLNRNWQNGNTEFDKIEGLLNTLEENLNNYRDKIHQLQESFNNLKEQHTQDVDTLTRRINDLNETIEKQDARITRRINDLNETIEKQDARISKLEDAVFNAVYINDTKSDVEAKPSITHEINDTHVVNDDNGIIIQDEHQTLPNDVN